MPKLKTSEKLVQKKLSGIFTSTKRDKAEKDKDKPKKNQNIEKNRQSISELDESENEAFDRDDLINEDDVPQIRSKLTFHNDVYNPMESLLHAFDLNYKFVLVLD
ncbi:unnamed protein product [Rhizophagus irregularis]|nr:unnamed protein product [Rhizophagus irregularis]